MKWYPVLVSFPAKNGLPAELHKDEIKGNSMEDAIKRAHNNWPEADLIVPDVTNIIMSQLKEAN